ncbi:NADPH-dependent FMN reductase [Sneathiella chinensis]|uniref:Flavoprotein n=1 Tax=Sneathiella chinensis TaxID=349750 RepID=A0ABQ5U531_9PROT|nr:NAD(P)H-dependent oxidoreductase [Sneathiella chinensis]GLQ07275.1 flavoprotein [Sneathiella chinensis]
MSKIGIIIGSVRDKSQSARIAHHIQDRLARQPEQPETVLFSLKDLALPLWSEEKWQADSPLSRDWAPVSASLARCDGFVFVVPEWAGMAPPHLKNFLLMCDQGELAHKPCQLIGVSAGMGGAYPVAELRMSGYKNNFLMWLPDHMILRQVNDLFTSDPATPLDDRLNQRLDYCLRFLTETARALTPVRQTCQDLSTYKNGM